jgi:hypothetical protein
MKHRGIVRVAVVMSVVLSSFAFSDSSIATATVCTYSGAPDNQVNMQMAFIPDIRMFVTESGEFKWEDTETGAVDDCGPATVENTNSVVIADFTDPADTPEIVIDRRRPWGPGLKLEKNGKSEIEVDVQAHRDHFETLKVMGSDRKNHFVFGAMGFNLNQDNDGNDIEITHNPIDELYVKGRSRADTLTVRGGSETGEPFLTTSVTLQGDRGADVLEGASGDENLRGLKGADRMFGGTGLDQMFSDAGPDLVVGGRGGDELYGMKGGDRLRGQRGPDELVGGPGIDDCSGGPGVDTLTGCEN